MIKTKSVYHDKIEPTDGTRILVMRKWPQGIGWEKDKIDMRLKELGPGKELLDDYNNKRISFPVYTKRYFEEMKLQKDKIMELVELSRKKTITLLCWEKSDVECHRRLLKELIEDYCNKNLEGFIKSRSNI